MMAEETDKKNVLKGHVKWFDPDKGFGFVVADTGGPDILLHANVLRNYGQSSIADGAIVELSVLETERGMQAVEVLGIDTSGLPAGAGLSDFADMDPVEMALAPLEPARVKWFDKAKGFGFANVFGSTEDIFVHVEILRHSGLVDLLPGEAVTVRVMDGNRGRMATEVLSWDAASKRPTE